ncbi:Fc receptor-like protein 5 isoform X2 [Colossoma macropomum]|uniref:Fc receptor-like protein 5 isoform X2 n=1 Tax=Colossoma macropomum TaxID=42526 RepID=UPI0018654F54|nr:Fc receptor-like protein 5 isoform X2 [Colossoma macropomum]
MGKNLGFQLMSVLLLAGVITKTGGSLPRPKLTGPSIAYVKSTVMFECKLSETLSPLTYELVKDSGEVLQTTDDSQGGQPITFSLRVNEKSEGQYYCRVRARGQTITSHALIFEVVIPVRGTHLVSDPDPPVIYEGKRFTLSCHVSKGTHLAYIWYHNKQKVTSPSSLHRLSGNTLTVDRATESHAGYYVCTATNQMGNISRASSSLEVNVVVKKHLSAPTLSFTLYHYGSGYHANVSCRSERGSPPVKFQLLLDGKDVPVQQEGPLEAWFTLPVNVGMDMGTLQCRAENDVQQLLSDPKDLEVVPVRRPSVVVEYLQTADYVVAAALLQCSINSGTFPLFSWSFNHSSLPSQGHSHAFTLHGKSLILTDINASNSGYYSCRVRDSFNSNSSWLESEGVLVEKTDFKMPSVAVIAVAFCCFLLAIIVGGACCLLWSIKHERNQDGGNNQDVDSQEQTNTEADRTMLETGSEPQAEETDTVVVEVEV